MERLRDLKVNIENILNKEEFYLNENKTRFQTGKHRMLVTGLLLNSGKPTTGRKRKRELRAALYNYIVKKDKNINMNKLIGTLSFIRDIEPEFYFKFQSYKDKLERKK